MFITWYLWTLSMSCESPVMLFHRPMSYYTTTLTCMMHVRCYVGHVWCVWHDAYGVLATLMMLCCNPESGPAHQHQHQHHITSCNNAPHQHQHQHQHQHHININININAPIILQSFCALWQEMLSYINGWRYRNVYVWMDTRRVPGSFYAPRQCYKIQLSRL